MPVPHAEIESRAKHETRCNEKIPKRQMVVNRRALINFALNVAYNDVFTYAFVRREREREIRFSTPLIPLIALIASLRDSLESFSSREKGYSIDGTIWRRLPEKRNSSGRRL